MAPQQPLSSTRQTCHARKASAYDPVRCLLRQSIALMGAAACALEPIASGDGGGAGAGAGAGGEGVSSLGGAGSGGTCNADVSSDPENCGACGRLCAPAQTCSSGECVCTPGASATFLASVLPIFAESCAAGMCHAPGMGAFGLDLGPQTAYASLVGVPAAQCGDARLRVSPSRPEDSYLVDKLQGTELCGGKRMPGKAGLPTDKIQIVVDWICAGALDD